MAALSYVKCDYGHRRSHYALHKTMFNYVDQWAEMLPDNEAFVVRPFEAEREAITYADLKLATERLAAWFRRAFAVTKGDRVGILSRNRLLYILVELALGRLGAVLVRLYVSLDSLSEIKRGLEVNECRLLLCQAESLSTVRQVVGFGVDGLEQVILLNKSQESGTDFVVVPDYTDIVVTEDELGEVRRIQSTVTPDDDFTVYCTSGSTGLPKFVIHTHGSLMNFAPQVMLKSGTRSSDRYFYDRPMACVGGASTRTVPFGATSVIANPWLTVGASPNTADNGYLLRLFTEERVTCGFTFAYILHDFVTNQTDLSGLNLKYLMSSGQLINYETLKRVKEILPTPIVNGYGLTEMGEVSSTEETDSLEVTSGTVGRIVPGVELKIVNPETREILPRGEIGMIAVRKAFKWRYLDPAHTLKSFDEDGYFYTGDLGRLHDNDLLEIVGRHDDVISVGAIKIYPATVENMLLKHPAVDKVVVFGVPDKRLYNVVGAAVLPKIGHELTQYGIQEFFKSALDRNESTGTNMSPKFIWIKQDFPQTASGKVDRKLLKEVCLRDYVHTD